MWTTKERISEPEDRSIDIIQFEKKKKKTGKKKELSKLIWDLKCKITIQKAAVIKTLWYWFDSTPILEQNFSSENHHI